MEWEKLSKICYGTLSLSPLQSELSTDEKVKLLLYAFEKGINFFDTAELYNNYEIFNVLLKIIKRNDIYISTKSYAYSTETAEKSVEKALLEMDTDYIDIFMLHEQVDINTYNGHREAFERLIKYRNQGIIRSIGISTHYIRGVRHFLKIPDVEIIHPIYNISGLGIVDGSIEEMTEAISNAHDNGIFILGMKALAGGHLSTRPSEALKFSFNSSIIDSTAVGMKYGKEIDYNMMLMNGEEPNLILSENVRKITRKLVISEWCTGCGKCSETCQQSALDIKNGKCTVDMNKCILCSYCADKCEEFCIKII